ncbi:hypothetical protein QBC35DRAFT_211273 [Podospora australis]|uniref:E3 ubiquitin-protein ligase listerin n=1 Tax=Podospora australis TaxID=1536484 RepID=A0AAN7AIQ6_9PEZI|nr:hypothetical protein QBC35DRAFT_211273 [Podospora australis]
MLTFALILQVQLYPRLSIDDSARVRELSHQLLIHLLNSAKKRIAKRLPQFVGPWLAGTFDRDRRVSRAASDGLSSFLQTKEKEDAFWKSVQNRALDFATEAIRETPDSLSDERSTTKQDSDAKYYRVIGASLCLVLNLLRRGDLSALGDGLEMYFGTDVLWTLSKAEDAFVRRSFYQLVVLVLETKPEFLKPSLQQVGRALIADSFKSSQVGSASDLLKALISLTRRFPQVWGSQKHPLNRLQQFVAQGSQGGSEEYWSSLDTLLSTLPDKTASAAVVGAFLASMRKGIADRLESFPGRQRAFGSYAHVLDVFLPAFTPNAEFIEDNLSSLTRQFLHPNPEASIPSPQRPEFIADAWGVVAKHPDSEVQKLVTDEWNKFAEAFVTRMSNSLPEVSEGYKKSQAAVAAEGERWFALVSKLEKIESLRDMALSSSTQILDAALGLLQRRNFKPFGAASVIQSALRHCPTLCTDTGILAKLFPAEQTDSLKVLVASPSLPYLVSDLTSVAGDRIESIWKSLVELAVQVSDRASAISAVRVLLSIPSTAAFPKELVPLQEFLISVWQEFTTAGSWRELAEASLSFDALESKSAHAVVLNVLSNLDVIETSGSALDALETILRNSPELIPEEHDIHVDLITRLLALTEISDTPRAEKAKGLRLLLDRHPSGPHPLSKILESHLHQVGPASLDVETLVQQAVAAFKVGRLPAEEAFPSSVAWMTELSSFLDNAPNPSLSLTSRMEGAYFLVQGSPDAQPPSPRRDSKGRSAPARMALYTVKLLSSGIELSSLPLEFQLELLYLLVVTDALATDQLASSDTNGLWRSIPGQDSDGEALEFTDLSSKEISTILSSSQNWRDLDMSGDSLIESLVNYMLKEARGFNSVAFYTAKALSALLQALVKEHGPLLKVDEWVAKLGLTRVSPDSTFVAAALLTGLDDTLASSKTISTLCTRLVSEIPGYTATSPRTLSTLVLLNLCLSVYETGAVPVEPRKQVMVLQQLTKWTETPDEMDYRLAAETCKAISRIFPAAKDAYGTFWERAVEYCLHLWQKAATDGEDERLPYIHASLKLVQTLKAADDANDDLQDALTEHKDAESAALLALLSVPRDAPSTLSSQLVDSLLARVVSKLPNIQLKDLSTVYESVASESREIQRAAFTLLHRALPAAQEDINLSVIMDKKPANLPDELLSLLLNAPNPHDYSDEDLTQFPVSIRSYLLAWHLVFDAYSTASYRVRSDYTENLKKDNLLTPLLGFLVEVLGHALARAIDLDREGFTTEHVRSYSIDLANSEPAERDMNWLLIHLFYLILKFTPSLFKMWYLDCPSNQTKLTIKTWMGKFFSPLIISDILDEVVAWSSNQDTSDADTEELQVKVHKPSREINAAYPVDEDTLAAIQLVVPDSYPLQPVEVISSSRAAIKEDKWQSMLKGIKAVIMFRNSSLVDGLMEFRRSISLAMKNQEECTICYSIIAQDKSLPDKKCSTCNHHFHRVCLFKWFQNSGRNTCPLCRNPIDYLGMDTKRRRPEHE